MRNKLKASHVAVSSLFDRLDADQDEAFLITVTNRASLRQDFTYNFGEIGNSLIFVPPKGSTALLDGVYSALSHMKNAHNPTKAVIVLSDGGDNHSRYSLKELLRLAVESDVLVYTICIFQDPQSPEEFGGPGLLSKLAKKTGGVPFVVGDLGVGSAMGAIADSLHSQYLLGFYPPENLPSKKYRKIKVRLRMPSGTPRLLVYTRSGYYAP